MPFLVKVAILLRQDLLMLIQEVPELVQLGVFEDLEASESCSDLVRWWNLGHFGDRLIQQVMLAFNKGVIVL